MAWAGAVASTIDGTPRTIGPGDSIFIPIASCTTSTTASGAPTACLCFLTRPRILPRNRLMVAGGPRTREDA